MANSDIIKIGFDYRASLAQFEKDTNGVFDGISNKAGKQRITIQLDAKDDKVIEKIKELQKLKLDKFTFEFGDSGLKEQLKTFGQLENKINEIITLSKGIGNNSSPIINISDTTKQIDKLENKISELTNKYDELQKKSSSIGSENISGNNISLIDNEEFKSLTLAVENTKQEIDMLKASISELESNDTSLINFTDRLDEELINVSNSVNKLTRDILTLQEALKSTSSNKTNISSGRKDAFPKTDSSATNASTSAIKEENNALEQTNQSAEKAANSKKKFANANKEVKDSANASVGAIKDENNAFDKNEWDKNVKAIQKYMDAVTELNHLKAKDKGTGKNTSVIADQEQEVERLKNIAYEAKKTLSSIANSNKADVNTWEKWVNVMKQFDQASQGSTRSIARLEDAMRNANNSQIEYMNSVIKRFQNSYDKYSTDASRNGYNPSVEFSDKLSSFNSSLNDLKNLSSSISNGEFVKQEQIDSFKRLTQNAEEAQKSLKNMSASEKGMKSVSVQKEIDKINQLLRENTRYSKEAKIELRSLITQLMSGDPTVNLEAIHTKVMEIKNAEELAGRAGKNFFDILASKSYYGFIGQMQSYLSMYVGFYGMMNSFRNGLSTVRELNTALTEMRKVSEETTQSLKNYQNTTFDVANVVGTTAKQIQTSTADYMRLGESLDVAAESAKTANVLLNVSEFDNIEDATKSLVAMGQAYKDLDKMTIVDKLNEVGKIVAQTYSNVWCYKNIAW